MYSERFSFWKGDKKIIWAQGKLSGDGALITQINIANERIMGD